MYQIILLFHIAAGTIACGAALGAIWVAKGKTAHARFGITYCLAMLAVVLSSFAMAYLKPNLFLALIGVFSGFLVASGYRRAKRRSGIPAASDWFIVAFGATTAVVMIGLAVMTNIALRPALLAFGVLMLGLALRDVVQFKRRAYQGAPRIAAHLTYMLGATIANVTAVMVVNWQSTPAWLSWLLPTFALVPLIVYWNIKLLKPSRVKP